MKNIAFAIMMIMSMAISAPSHANLTFDVYEDINRMAVLGTPSGQYNAAISLIKTTENYSAAALWLQKSADQGYPHAQAVLGSLYSSGLGVKPDVVKGYALVIVSMPRIEQGVLLKTVFILRDDLEQMMSQIQLDKANVMISCWRKTRAKPEVAKHCFTY